MKKPSKSILINSMIAAFSISVILIMGYKVALSIRANGLVDAFLSFHWVRPPDIFGSMFMPALVMTVLFSIVIVLICMVFNSLDPDS